MNTENKCIYCVVPKHVKEDKPSYSCPRRIMVSIPSQPKPPWTPYEVYT